MTEEEKGLIPVRDKTVENLDTPPLIKTPKSQLTVEQPSTKKTTPYEKIYSMSNDKRLQQDGRRDIFVV